MKVQEQEPARARMRAVVQGYVQGVSFRYYTQRRARELGLTGYVRNLWDGSVEVMAEGRRRDVDELLAFLYVGPGSAEVTHVDVQWSAPSGEYARFEVRH